MEKIIFDHNHDGLHFTLGITEDRANQLFKLFQKAEWELSCPDKDGFTGAELLERFISYAETPAETIFCAYLAGAHFECITTGELEEDFEDE